MTRTKMAQTIPQLLLDLSPKKDLPVPPGSENSCLWAFEPGTVQLDHGAYGGCPSEVTATQDQIRRIFESDVHGFVARKYSKALQHSKEVLAKFLHADIQGLVLLPGATMALNVVLQSYSLAPNDQILTINHAYSSTNLIMREVVKRANARLVVVQIPFPTTKSGDILERILAHATKRTRLAVIDHVTSRTALVLPIEQIVSHLNARGIDTLVDGAHAPGAVDVNVNTINAAYYIGDCHKWMCAPRGSGFMHIREDRRHTIRPLVLARSAHENEARDHSDLEHGFDWLGTVDTSALLSIPAAIDFLHGTIAGGPRAYAQRNHMLALEARLVVCSALGIESPCPDNMLASMFSIPLPDEPELGAQPSYTPLQDVLWKKYRIAVPVFSWPARPKRVLRVSVQVHNSRAQIEYLAAALKTALREERSRRA